MRASNAELVKKVLSLIERGRINEAGTWLSEDFRFAGAAREPLDKKTFLELHRELVQAIPDWSYHARDAREQGDTVRLTVRVTGTNRGVLDIPSLGILAVPATGVRIALPEQALEATVRDGAVTALREERVPGGGVEGILRQLGIGQAAPADV